MKALCIGYAIALNYPAAFLAVDMNGADHADHGNRFRIIAEYGAGPGIDDEDGRDAHLNGQVAAALMAKEEAGDLFAKPPQIHKLFILADKRS